MTHPLGAIYPGAASPHDWLIQELIGEPPATLPLAASVPSVGPVFDQSNPAVQGTCVSDATVGIKNQEERLQLPAPFRYDDQSSGRGNDSSVNRFYLEGTGDATYQQGWYVKGAMEWARTRGVVAVDGHRYLIASYYSLTTGDLGANIRNTIATVKRPVQIAMPWYSSYFADEDGGNSYPNGILPPPRPREGIAGGHSLYVWRYCWYAPQNRWLYCVRNSWGPTWGLNGNVYMGDEHLATVYEAYVAVDR